MDADAIIIGAGIAGMTIALRLQARGLTTLVLEAHGQVGGCAGFFSNRGFSFDVGATTLVDFEPGGVGGQFLAETGLALAGENLPGYRAWLPDREVNLYREVVAWKQERLTAFGDTPQHRQFWSLLDRLAETFWAASRNGIKLPFRSSLDFFNAAKLIPLAQWPLSRYLFWSMADALRACGLEKDTALRGLLAMLLQDTVHASLEDAPLVNAALGATIRGAGLTRPHGGMRGFWSALLRRYRALGGVLRVGTRVERLSHAREGFCLHTRRGNFIAPQIVSTLPIWNTAQLGLPAVTQALAPYIQRDQAHLGGAAAVFLGVPENEVSTQVFTHHQILLDYALSLGNGNNMFISVSAPGDHESAPPGYRAVMLSTHCELREWENLADDEYAARKAALGQHLLDSARRVYPNLGAQARVFQVGTPRTYAKYTLRYRGAVGGIQLTPRNSNFYAVPYQVGVPGFWQAGDTTWPGLGTVACVLGGRHVAEGVFQAAEKLRHPHRNPLAFKGGKTYESSREHSG